jgi:hypothetical protein
MNKARMNVDDICTSSTMVNHQILYITSNPQQLAYQATGLCPCIHIDGTLEWTQPTLTQSILKDLKLDGEEIKGRQNKPNVKAVPANITVPLTDHKGSPDHDPKDFEYRHVIGKLLYLEKCTKPDISCAVHQCARHCVNPKVQHTAAVKRIGRYLLGTKDRGLIMKPNQVGMECWVDAAHASEWNNKSASSDSSTARSRMGYVITYAGCPMHWSSKMQTEIALSTTEAES